MKKLSSISAFFPAYHDGGTIPSMVMLACRALSQVTDDFEVIVVNDGSHDDPADYTGEVLAETAARYGCVRVITHPVNRGYGAALRSGFAAATKEWVFYTDGDAQYDPREVSLLVEAVQEGVDIVNGYKIVRSDPLHRVIIGRLYHHGVKRLFGLKVRDVDCDFRLMRRAIFDTVTLTKNSGVICLEMMTKITHAGFTIVEAPVHHYHRAYGKSQFFNFGRVARTLADVLKLWWALVVRRDDTAAGTRGRAGA